MHSYKCEFIRSFHLMLLFLSLGFVFCSFNPFAEIQLTLNSTQTHSYSYLVTFIMFLDLPTTPFIIRLHLLPFIIHALNNPLCDSYFFHSFYFFYFFFLVLTYFCHKKLFVCLTVYLSVYLLLVSHSVSRSFIHSFIQFLPAQNIYPFFNIYHAFIEFIRVRVQLQ